MSESTADPRSAPSTNPARPGRTGKADGASGASRTGPLVRGRRDDAKAGTPESHGSLASGEGYLGILHRFVRDTRPELSESEIIREVQRLYRGEREGPRPPNERRERERISRRAIHEARRRGC